jgi:hypothetical protein
MRPAHPANEAGARVNEAGRLGQRLPTFDQFFVRSKLPEVL